MPAHSSFGPQATPGSLPVVACPRCRQALMLTGPAPAEQRGPERFYSSVLEYVAE